MFIRNLQFSLLALAISLFFIGCSDTPESQSTLPLAEESWTSFTDKLGITNQVSLANHLENNKLLDTSSYQFSVNWNAIEKYVVETPIVYEVDHVSNEINEIIEEGMNLFYRLTRNVNSEESQAEIKHVVKSFPQPDSSYRSFWHGGYFYYSDDDRTYYYQSKPAEVDEAFYEKIQSRVQGLRETNVSQIIRYCKADIEDFLENNDNALENYLGNKSVRASATKNWIDNSLNNYITDLEVLEKFLLEISDPKMKLSIWQKFYGTKGLEIDEYIKNNKINSHPLTSSTINLSRSAMRNDLVVCFPLKEWNLYYIDRRNPLVNINGYDRSGAETTKVITVDNLNLKVLKKKRIPATTFAHQQEKDQSGNAIQHQIEDLYYLEVENTSKHRFCVKVDQATFNNAIEYKPLPKTLYKDLIVVQQLPRTTTPLGFIKI